jgi:DNA helicase-2/ATP-dependent DNA helicase PcrA
VIAPDLRPIGPQSTRATPNAPAPVSLEQVSALLAGLDPAQKRAVRHGDGPLLVVAGPGTGKTHVLSRRVAWLIATKRARPSQILALTFTEKAADEMQERVDLLVPYGYADAAIHTFHAFGDRLIREFAFELGFPSDPRVLSRAESVMLLREHLFELGLDRFRPLGDPTRFLAALVALFGRARDEDVSPAEHRAFAERLKVLADRARSAASGDTEEVAAAALVERAAQQSELATAYARYQELLARNGCLDFGDQLGLALRLLREHPAARAELVERYRYVVVDEFQDTNPAQLELVAQIAGERPNVTVVGDDDQSIYTFRGAALSNVLGFQERFGGARIVVLRRNYRSRAPILDAARRLIRHNDPGRLEVRAGLDKQLLPPRRAGVAVPVGQAAFATVAEEADWVADRIAERLAGGLRPRDVAILVRTNADADPFLRSLNLRGIPWRFSGASGLYARPEVRELLAFVRVVAELESTVDLYALATGEPYGLGGPDLTDLLGLARRHHRSLWWAFREILAQPAVLRLRPATRQSVSRLVADLEAATELAHRKPAGEVLYDHLRRSGRLARLTAADTPAAEQALRNVARFFEIVRSRGRLLPDQRLPFLAAHLDTMIDAGDDPSSVELDDDLDAVAVLTVHKSKGLEFETVFLVGLVEGRFPGRGRRELLPFPDELCRRAIEDFDEAPWAEERRLCYVAMTRAREELFLTHSVEGANGRRRRPSPFIAEALDRPAATAPSGLREPLLRVAADDAAPSIPAAASSGGPLELSFSQLDDYLTCPQRYRLRHVLGVPTPAHHALAYGSALHQAVAAFGQRQAKGRPMSEQELLDVFRTHWVSDGFLSREHEEARYAAGEAALRRFRAEQRPEDAPLAIEQEFSFRLDGDRIRGRFDRIDRTAEGVVITDFKSGDVRDPAKARKKARESLQLAIYALAHEAASGSLPAAVQLHFLDSGVVGRAPLEPRRLEEARRKVRAAADGIRAGRFVARPDQIGCSYCPYRDICPSSAA